MTMKQDMELRELPVIMISALDDLDNIVRCLELGAEDYLPKPFDPDDPERPGRRRRLEKRRLRERAGGLRRDRWSENVSEPTVCCRRWCRPVRSPS